MDGQVLRERDIILRVPILLLLICYYKLEDSCHYIYMHSPIERDRSILLGDRAEEIKASNATFCFCLGVQKVGSIRMDVYNHTRSIVATASGWIAR